MKQWWRKIQRYIKHNRAAVALILIVGLAIFFRFWHLHDIPPGLYEDEAANGIDVFSIQDGDIRPFYPANNGREGLFFYLQAIFVTIFGNSILALRMAPALIGVGAVVATYAMTKEWFGRRVGLLAAFITASAPWAVLMSRNGFRAGMMVLMVPLVAWLYTKAIKSRGWVWYVAAGASIGLGFYTYLAYRFIIAVVLLLLIFALIFYRQWLKQHFLKLFVSGLVALMVVLPLLVYGFQHPQEVFSTRSSVSITNAEKPVVELAKNIGKTAIMFNVIGDSNFRHNLGGAPMLDAFIGIMFLLGLLLAVRRIKDWRYFSLLAIFSVMLLPMLLSAEGIPHALRSIGVLPVVFIFATLGIKELLGRWRSIFPRNPAALTLGLVIIGGALVLSTYYNYQRYFEAWANAPQTFEAYSEDAVAIAQYMIERPSGHYFVIIDGHRNNTVEYLAKHKVSYQRIDPQQLKDISTQADSLIIVDKDKFLSADPFLAETKAVLVTSYESPNRVGTVLYKIYKLPTP